VLVVHLLRHVREDIIDNGPLGCHDLFPTETLNGLVGSLVHGKRDIDKSVADAFAIMFGMGAMEKHLQDCMFIIKCLISYVLNVNSNTRYCIVCKTDAY
jgi:hypothetical protein